MMRQCMIRGILLLVVGVLLRPPQATAGVILITHGETIKHIGEVSQQFREGVRNERKIDAAIGYMYSSFGIFWLDLWTWGGTYCLYKEMNALPLPVTPKEAAMFLGKSENELSTPFFYKFPPGLMILIGIVVVAVVVKVFNKRSVNKILKLFEDPRYQKALEVFSEHSEKAEKAAAATSPEGAAPEGVQEKPAEHTGFEAAIQYLVSEGIDRKEAEENLGMMLTVVAQAHAQEQGASPPA